MKRSYIAVLALTVALASCKDNEVFEKEMYKNRVALISTDPHNIFDEVVQLTGEEVTGYIAASVGGTDAPANNMVIELEENPEPLARYNYALYDVDVSRYAKLLPSNRYEIVNPKIQINAGERTGRTMIKLRPDGLSPDSAYFIGLKAKEVPGLELNPTKNTVLFRVMIKNNYASQAEDSFYTMTGMANGMATAANKELFPLTRNGVRMIAGDESFVSTEAALAKTSIKLEVDENNKVTIKPYKDIIVTQLDGDPMYPNVFKVEEAYGRKTNVFLLSYSYKIGNVTKIMKERVEKQVN